MTGMQVDHILTMIQIATNLCIVPLVGALWTMQQRLSKIEGHLIALELMRERK